MTGSIDERLCASLERWGGLPCSDYATEALRRELAARGLKVVETPADDIQPTLDKLADRGPNGEMPKDWIDKDGSPVSNGLEQAETVCSMDNSPLREAVARVIAAARTNRLASDEAWADRILALVAQEWCCRDCGTLGGPCDCCQSLAHDLAVVKAERDAAFAKLSIAEGWTATAYAERDEMRDENQRLRASLAASEGRNGGYQAVLKQLEAKLAAIAGDEAVDTGAMRMHMGDIDQDGWKMLPKGEKQRAIREFRAALTAAVASVEQGEKP